MNVFGTVNHVHRTVMFIPVWSAIPHTVSTIRFVTSFWNESGLSTSISVAMWTGISRRSLSFPRISPAAGDIRK